MLTFKLFDEQKSYISFGAFSLLKSLDIEETLTPNLSTISLERLFKSSDLLAVNIRL